MKERLKTGLLIGSILILLSIFTAVLFEHDIAFIFAGGGVVIIGIAFLYYINGKPDKDGK